MLRRHQAAGPGTATWLPALFFFPCGGLRDLVSAPDSEQEKPGGATPGSRGPAPAASPPAAAGGPSSALHPPAGLPPPSSSPALSLARSFPPPGGLAADSAARCSRGWKMAGNDCGALLDEELSSFFLNYLSDTQVLPAGDAGQGRGCRAAGGCSRSCRGKGAQRWAHRGDRGGGSGCRAPPFHVPCAALRYRRSELQVASACCSIGGHSQGHLESPVPYRQS